MADPRRLVLVRLLPLAVTTLLLGTALAFATPFLAVFLSRAVHAGPVASAAFLVLTPLSAVAVSTVLGRISDRRGRRRQMIAALALSSAAGYTLYATFTNYWILLAASMTLLAAGSGMFPQVFAYARETLDQLDPTRAPLMINYVRTLFSVTWVTGPPLAGLVLGWAGFTGLHATTAACFGLAAVIAVVWLADPAAGAAADPAAGAAADPAAGAASPRPAGAPGSPAQTTVVARGLILRLGAGFTCLLCATALGLLTMPLFVTEVLHEELADAGVVLGLTAALEIPLMLLFGYLANRYGLRPMIVAGTVVGIGYYAVATASTAVWQLGVAQALNACFIAAVQGLGITYFQNMIPGAPGRATTAFANSQRLAWMLAGPVLGLAQHLGYRVAFGACAVLGILGVALLLTTSEPSPEEQAAQEQAADARGV